MDKREKIAREIAAHMNGFLDQSIAHWLATGGAVRLAESLAIMPGVEVKKLKWEQPCLFELTAKGEGVTYLIRWTQSANRYQVTVGEGVDLCEPKPSLEDARATCQRDYEFRILSTLQPAGELVEAAREVYVASRASVPARSAMWRAFRDEGFPINSTWIDEAGEGQTLSHRDLWVRCLSEVSSARAVVLYAEPDDFPLKGALLEAGAALVLGKPVIVCLPGVSLENRSCRPIGSWINHPLVMRINDPRQALTAALGDQS